jgi:hypothetical protein
VLSAPDIDIIKYLHDHKLLLEKRVFTLEKKTDRDICHGGIVRNYHGFTTHPYASIKHMELYIA